ncbi:MAG: hypothetical protein PF501_04285 [Salinisphaera sp.]|nr:hypothetical protein [Salinisphaera sp.]
MILFDVPWPEGDCGAVLVAVLGKGLGLGAGIRLLAGSGLGCGFGCGFGFDVGFGLGLGLGAGCVGFDGITACRSITDALAVGFGGDSSVIIIGLDACLCIGSGSASGDCS